MVPELVLIEPAPVPDPPETVPLGTLFATVMVIAAGSVATDTEATKNEVMIDFMTGF